jgi:hypothetical protein
MRISLQLFIFIGTIASVIIPAVALPEAEPRLVQIPSIKPDTLIE